MAFIAGAPGGRGKENPGPGGSGADLPVVAFPADPRVKPVDISNAVLFPASDEARYITGVTLPVDAGSLLR
ncbi:putative carveol dehydrogenase [Mycolicibacterium hassiacum DSM 44199]|uniref:Putative carveol dehydrogenase n=1 Tax=Mycolicibacterium hassiacum (strain DSM 44199 / CIP 105218 / JCM 12690 / 3849) TaxID=1122247 RepID=K5BDL1_MYCHD|nr:putative carveol dehydrogenase [Mycolicibacterium hassiacum DSM 44199]